MAGDPVFKHWKALAIAIQRCQTAARRGLAAASDVEKRRALREAEKWEKEVNRLERVWNRQKSGKPMARR